MRRFLLQEEDGQGMVEYALILGIISLAAITVLVPMGKQIVENFNTILNAVDQN